MQEIDFRAWLEVQEKKRGDEPLDPKSVDQYITDARCVKKSTGTSTNSTRRTPLPRFFKNLSTRRKPANKTSIVLIRRVSTVRATGPR